MNKDGREDIFVEGVNDSHATLLLNDGNGNFSIGWQNTAPHDLIAKPIEINHDGKLDIVKVTEAGDQFILSVYLNQN